MEDYTVRSTFFCYTTTYKVISNGTSPNFTFVHMSVKVVIHPGYLKIED